MTKRNNNQTMEYNSYEHVVEEINRAEHKRNRVLVGLGISAVATGLTLYGLFGGHPGGLGMAYIMLAFLAAIPAYILGGGFSKALKAAGKLAKFGWLIIPFPYDLLTGFLTLIIAGFLFFCIPTFFILKNFFNANSEYNEMKRCLSHYAPAEQC